MPTKPDSAVEPLISVEGLHVHYRVGGSTLGRLLGLDTGTVKAVDGVDLDVRRGEVIGVVGESGSGKSTLGRALLGLAPATAGSITYRPRSAGGEVVERRVSQLRGGALRKLRTDLQMVFQDPAGALNPSMTIETAVGHPLKIHHIGTADERRARVRDALERVGLTPAEQFLDKYPTDLSGGQKQRAVIARAIILDPDVLIADEPVSMLDMSVRTKILELMLDLKRELGLTYLYITHDLATAKFFCDRVAIMYLGRIVEIGETAEIFANPRHPYTKALLEAVPEPDPSAAAKRDLPPGEIPDAAAPPLGCAFHPRCPEATGECGWESRDLRVLLEDRWTRLDADAYDEERRLVGDLDRLDVGSRTAVLGSKGTRAEVRDLLERMRAEEPERALWQGVEEIRDGADGVEVVFVPGIDPRLRRNGPVEVACVLYPEEE